MYIDVLSLGPHLNIIGNIFDMNNFRRSGEVLVVFLICFPLFLAYFLTFGPGSIISVSPLGTSEALPTFSQVRSSSINEPIDYEKTGLLAKETDTRLRRELREGVVQSGNQFSLSPCNMEFRKEYISSVTRFVDGWLKETLDRKGGKKSTGWVPSPLEQPVVEIMQKIRSAGLIAGHRFSSRKREVVYLMFVDGLMDRVTGNSGNFGRYSDIEPC